MIADLRFAVRSMRRSAGFALVAVGVLAGAIGINAAVLGIADAVLFRPLPYDAPYWLGGALFVGLVAAFEWLATILRVRETEWATFGILGFAALGWLASLMLRRSSAGGRGEGMSTRATEQP